MKKIKAIDVRTIDHFSRVGYDYRKIEETEDYMVWEMSCGGYEIWKPKWYVNPDGNKVWVKPSDEQFGVYGWYCTTIEALNNRKRKILETKN